MQAELKLLSRAAIPAALEKAHLYRLLNEPWQAESICEDVLRIDARNQTALVTLLLAVTDQFGTQIQSSKAQEVLHRIEDPYEHAYYAGIVAERSARARVREGLPGSNFKVYEELRGAMELYERAEALRPQENDDAVLRWNTCARMLKGNQELRPQPEEEFSPVLDD